MEERSIDKLARYTMLLGGIVIVAVICWYFRSVLGYIAGAFVVSLIGQPVMRLLRKVSIKGYRAPDWLLAIFTIILIFCFLALLVTQVIPLVSGIVRETAAMHANNHPDGNLIDAVNVWLIAVFPSLGDEFDLAGYLIGKLREVTSLSNVSGVIGSLASTASSIGVGLFATIFISFFFIKDEHLFGKIICALVPDRIEASVGSAVLDVERLLSRYFVGLLLEVLGVALIDFLGLWLIARIGANYALGIAFIAGMLNIIPYVGPLIGEVLGVVLCVVLKYGTGTGLDVGILAFALIVLAIMLAAQLVDNLVYQPVIYSKSIHSTPLEIFIVLLIGGRIGGVLGILLAIPTYTVVRVIAARFFQDKKVVRRLIGSGS